MNKFAFLPYKKYTFLKHLLESIEYLVDVCEYYKSMKHDCYPALMENTLFLLKL
jgi:hypothetical protein